MPAGAISLLFLDADDWLYPGELVPLLLELGRYETVVTSGNAFARAALEANLPMPEEQFRIAADGYLAAPRPQVSGGRPRTLG